MIKNIIFDFDGVILDSVPIKTKAFKKLFESFSNEQVEKFIDYHKKNGGISRYLKIKIFFEDILYQSISKKEIQNYAKKYSELTREELTNPKYLIEDAVHFIKKNHQKYSMHIASGADEEDLRYICQQLNLTKYFLSINGSPAKKNEIVSNILRSNHYDTKEVILIGDSINDYEAAYFNNIAFFAYNNITLMQKYKYIKSFKNFFPNDNDM